MILDRFTISLTIILDDKLRLYYEDLEIRNPNMFIQQN